MPIPPPVVPPVTITLEDTLLLADKLFTFYYPRLLRYVRDHFDVIEDEDHNDHVTLWRWQQTLCEAWKSRYPEIASLVDELKDIVSSMYYVKERDDVLSREHNLFVRAWRELVEIDGKLASNLAEYGELARVVDEMVEIGYGSIYYADLHNIFARAWELQIKLDLFIEKLRQANK
ncbi:MAG: hypothetical protein DRN15_10725 [Thermoprotei archaeon]|nr:MAG: hypothetical protein DRN15_10725 [Thermoprotei archaeon]